MRHPDGTIPPCGTSLQSPLRKFISLTLLTHSELTSLTSFNGSRDEPGLHGISIASIQVLLIRSLPLITGVFSTRGLVARPRCFAGRTATWVLWKHVSHVLRSASLIHLRDHKKRGTKLVGDTQPPLEYLVASSQSSLESYLLSRVTKLAELRQEIRKLVKEWVQIQADERAARWILRYRNSDASREDSAASSPRALSTLDFHTSLCSPPVEEGSECFHRKKYFQPQSLRRHSRISPTPDRSSKFRSEGVGSAADSRSDDRRRNVLVRSVCAMNSLVPANKGDSVGARPAKSSSDLPLASPLELLACHAATTADNVATPSEPNGRPEMRRCNSYVCAIVASHFRRAPLSQFLSVSLGELRVASQQNRKSRSH